MRYCIGFAPSPCSALFQAGSRWLGWNSAEGLLLDQPHCSRIGRERLDRLTRPRRHVGFQAVIKPPFRLTEPCREEDLVQALARFAARQKTVPLGRLRICRQGHCFCLRPETGSADLQEIAASCIRHFTPYSRALGPSERARYRAELLTVREKENLERWGSPYVFDQFRFSFPLTSRMLDGSEIEAMYTLLSEYFAPVLQGCFAFDALCLYQEQPTGPHMRCIRRFPLHPASAANACPAQHEAPAPEKERGRRHERSPS